MTPDIKKPNLSALSISSTLDEAFAYPAKVWERLEDSGRHKSVYLSEQYRLRFLCNQDHEIICQFNQFKKDSELAKEIILELWEALCGKDQMDINCIDNTLALMVEGEGSDPEVYQIMAKSALIKLREALANVEAKLRGMK